MFCLIRKIKLLEVNSALKDLVVKFAVLLLIIIVFYCFRLISFHTGFLSCNYFPILFTKKKEKKKNFWKLLKIAGRESCER